MSDAGPIDSVTTLDANTVVFKLAFPYGPILEMLAHNQHPYIMPTEFEDKYDPKSEMRDSGPYMLTTANQPTTGFISTNVIKLSVQANPALKDVGVRRAASMVIDRELAIDAQNNLSAFRDIGLPTAHIDGAGHPAQARPPDVRHPGAGGRQLSGLQAALARAQEPRRVHVGGQSARVYTEYWYDAKART